VRSIPPLLLVVAALAAPADALGAPKKSATTDLMAKKPDPPAPAALPQGKQPVGGALLDSGVNSAVASHRPAFQACLEKATKRRPGRKVSARATLVLTVRPDGRVSDAQLAERGLRHRPLGQCLVRTSYRMSFPAFEGSPMRVDVPLALSAQ